MRAHPLQPSRRAWFSPWIIVGSVCILAGILVTLAVKNVHREREFMERALLSQANVLMRSIEAGSRAGMMGMGWGRRQIQTLMEETAQQPDVLFVALVTPGGQIVAHSRPERVGQVLRVALPEEGQSVRRFSEEDGNTFEVVRRYEPWFRHGRQGGREMCELGAGQGGVRDLFIVVGLDPSPFRDALRQDLQHTVILFGVMLLVGAAGFSSLTWAQNYRNAKRSLQDIRAFASTIVNQMPVGMIATDPGGRVQRTNEAARSILRQPVESGMGIERFPCFASMVRKLRQEERIVEWEAGCAAADGPPVPLLVNAAVIRDGERRAAGFAFLFSDMTNVRQLEERLRRSERLASLGRLAAGIAHEIRNPLSSIKGFAAILAGRSREDEKSRKIADVMVQEVERLNRVVSQLLDFARPTELHRKACSCRELLDHTLRLIERDALHQEVRVESRVDPGNLSVELDPDRFSQVLLNLYINALQAMERGGTLRVEVFRDGDRVAFRVTDTGSGIPREQIAHIFDPYFTTKPNGVGLGLANVHKFVEAHGGTIAVESTSGGGTSFDISIPVAS
ncbi:MAG: ATP-binding protein [Syntrophobacteraceae bacterium]